VSANYPGNPISFTPKVDLQDTVVAADVNGLYAEVTAMANTALGTNPHIRDSVFPGSWDSSTTKTWGGGVADRINNVENGTQLALDSLVNRNGGTTIRSSSNQLSLKIRAQTGQTSNLFSITNASDAPLVTVTTAGQLTAVSVDGGTP
jgi:hypothetical protein